MTLTTESPCANTN